MADFAEILRNAPLVCPDDRTRLVSGDASLTCPQCRRAFPIHAGRILDALPTHRVELTGDLAARYRDDYASAFERRFTMDLEPWAWGTRSVHSPREIARRERSIAWLRSVITSDSRLRRGVLCDISAGAGHFTLSLADVFQDVLHCDLLPNGLVYACQRADEAHHDNVRFVRHDYLRSPLQDTADALICVDTLIRGHAHELALLASIRTALKSGGVALLDFANLRRQYLRRVLRPRERLALEPRAYTASGAHALLLSAGFGGAELLRPPSGRFAPLPRLVFRVRKI